ncbi:ATP-binding protein [Kitasatospora aureofaciens]|uniref:ATP-binding protein n=1 Tax=Kitasatospora aureofaciens TaxID=1894 RepID=UPI0037C91FDB
MDDQWEQPCPYPRLRPFGPTAAERFFGRSQLIMELVGRLERIGGQGPLIVVGPSGVGKSSLLGSRDRAPSAASAWSTPSPSRPDPKGVRSHPPRPPGAGVHRRTVTGPGSGPSAGRHPVVGAEGAAVGGG